MECYDVTSFVTFQDLLQIPSGTLVHLLQKVVAFAKEHVLSCWLCRQKGFICEVCNNPKVIYPFDMESTYRVRHRYRWNENKVDHEELKYDNADWM